MRAILARFMRFYTAFLIIFFLYLAASIFIGFFAHISINNWTLIAAFASYCIAAMGYMFYRRLGRRGFILLLAAVVLTPLLYWTTTYMFGQTYDLSYDGQDYQQSAIIALADNWNPIYQKAMPIHINNPVDEPVDIGYGKIIWSIDASAYKLTHNLSATTAINFIVGLLAASMLYQALRKLMIAAGLSISISFVSVVTVTYVNQFFSSREDALSYDFLLIGIGALVLLTKAKPKLSYFLCLATSLIFLPGIKDTNAFTFLPLLLATFFVIYTKQLYKLRSCKAALLLGVLIGCITCINPYVTNSIRYHAIDYPFNETQFTSLTATNNVPPDLQHDNRLVRLYYGIFASANSAYGPGLASQAHLKLPFTFSANELATDAAVSAKLVGGYGFLFSGIMCLSLATYGYLGICRKTPAENKLFIYLSVVLVVVILSCLLNPDTNYARFNSQLYLFPVAVTVALLLMARGMRGLQSVLALILLSFMITNVLLELPTAYSVEHTDFAAITAQLSYLKSTHVPYNVYAGTFYSNYALLETKDIPIVIALKPLHCQAMIVLDNSDATNTTTLPTELCPQ